jgi:hypothetical protein
LNHLSYQYKNKKFQPQNKTLPVRFLRKTAEFFFTVMKRDSFSAFFSPPRRVLRFRWIFFSRLQKIKIKFRPPDAYNRTASLPILPADLRGRFYR